MNLMQEKNMSSTLKIFAMALLVVGIVSACHTGPAGPDPGQELKVSYTTGALNLPTNLEKSSDMVISGDSVRMTFVYYMHDTLKGSEAQFNDVAISPFDTPNIIIRFKGSIPSSPGTFEWEPTRFNSNAPPSNADITQGVVVRFEGRTYFPVEGATVVTSVFKHPSGNIAGIQGYFNGKLQGVYPSGFTPSASKIFPDGYDPLNPSLVGEKLTVHSCAFINRSVSNISSSTGQ